MLRKRLLPDVPDMESVVLPPPLDINGNQAFVAWEIFSEAQALEDRAAEMMQAAGAKLDVAAVKQVLTDQQAPEWPIAVPFQWREGMAMEIGTVTSLVMDLGARTMHATPGSPLEHDFTVLEL